MNGISPILDNAYRSDIEDVPVGKIGNATREPVKERNQLPSNMNSTKQKTLPPELANTMQQIVGQLEILTQVRILISVYVY